MDVVMLRMVLMESFAWIIVRCLSSSSCRNVFFAIIEMSSAARVLRLADMTGKMRA